MEPQPPRAAQAVWLLRTAAALVGLAMTLLTLTHGWDRTVRTALGLSSPKVVWGDPDGSHVCVAEVRAQPSAGAWRCISWQPVASGQVVRRADASLDGGACTHRVVDAPTGVWDCLTRAAMSQVALHYRGGTPQPVFGDLEGRRLCIREYRATVAAAWSCEEWGVRIPGVYFARAVPPRQMCLARWADQDTGAWACGQRPW